MIPFQDVNLEQISWTKSDDQPGKTQPLNTSLVLGVRFENSNNEITTRYSLADLPKWHPESFNELIDSVHHEGGKILGLTRRYETVSGKMLGMITIGAVISIQLNPLARFRFEIADFPHESGNEV